MRPVNVVLFWHQHQPFYRDLSTGEALMPWVRLHAIKDYYGMARMAQRFPQCKHVINLVPSLVRQVVDYTKGASDRWLDRARLPADGMKETDVDFILNNFFMANYETMVRTHARYGELLARRKMGKMKAEEVRGQFTEADIRDLQVWSILAWFHPLAVQDRGELAELIKKGANFSENDKAVLFAAQDAILGAVLPMHRQLEEAGIVELTTTPYYHPILPLLCDMRSMKRAMPDAPLPANWHTNEIDARLHVKRAVESHEAMFGRKPRGMWPSEGSVSEAIVPILAEAGIQWIATDEDILMRSLKDQGTEEPRDQAVYRPWRVRAGGATVNAIFRDHGLSDAIGFRYQDWDAGHAAGDICHQLKEIGKRSPNDPCLASVILDGENCWEYYHRQGIDFLERLYGTLSKDPELQPVRPCDFLEQNPPQREVGTLFPGSWINSNFYIWSGHAEDRRAWEAVFRVRQDLVRASGGEGPPAEPSVPAAGEQRTPGQKSKSERRTKTPNLAMAWESLYVAEGSDWFWWYGDDHFSGMDDLFDLLFRRHLQNVYRFLGERPPAFLETPIGGVTAMAVEEPRTLLHVKVDGRVTSYFEWLGAGVIDLTASGAMTQASRPLFEKMYFGFSHEELYLRLDPADDWRERAPQDLEMVVRVNWPVERIVRIRDIAGQPKAEGLEGFRVAAGAILEMAAPFAGIGATPGSEVTVSIHLEREGHTVERIPGPGPLRLTAPAEDFEVHYWQV
jgi:alpha-amylase/alpha-mannosidase (GH57 family)